MSNSNDFIVMLSNVFVLTRILSTILTRRFDFGNSSNVGNDNILKPSMSFLTPSILAITISD